MKEDVTTDQKALGLLIFYKVLWLYQVNKSEDYVLEDICNEWPGSEEYVNERIGECSQKYALIKR